MACFVNEEDQKKFNILSGIIGEKLAMADVVRHDGLIRSPRAVMEDLENDLLNFREPEYSDAIEVYQQPEKFNEENFRSKYAQLFNRVDLNNSKKAIEDFSIRLNIPVQFYNAPANENIVNSWYSGGTVYFAEGTVNSNSIFHEFSHPIIKSLAKDNMALFNKLYDDLIATEKGLELYNKIANDKTYQQLYEKDSQEFKEEVLVQALTEVNAEEIKKRTALGEILFSIKKFLRKIFGRSINLSNLSSQTTLKEFAQMINTESFNLDYEFLNVDDVIYFEKKLDVIKGEINKQVEKEAQNLIDALVDDLTQQINFLKKGQLQELTETLSVSEGQTFLDQMQRVLNELKGIEIASTLGTRTKIQTSSDEYLADRIRTVIRQIIKIETVANRMLNKVDEIKNADFNKIENLNILNAIGQFVSQYQNFIKNKVRSNNSFFDTPMNNKVDEIEQTLQKLQRAVIPLQVDLVIDPLYEHFVNKTKDAAEIYKKDLERLEKSGNSSAYIQAHEEYYGLTPEELNEYNALEAKRNANIEKFINNNRQNARFLELRNKKFTFQSIAFTKEEFREILIVDEFGTFGRKINSVLESFMLNQDLFTSSFYSFFQSTLKRIEANANSRQAALLKDNKLEELAKAAGWGFKRMINSPKLGREIGELVDIGEIDKDGNLEEKLEWQFLSAVTNWEGPLLSLKQKVDEAKDEYLKNQTDKTKIAFYNAQKELFYELKNEFNQKYKDVYYEVEELLYKDEIGQKAKMARDAIYEKLNYLGDAQDAIGNPELSKKREEVLRELFYLKSKVNTDLSFKTDEELEIAERLREYDDKRKQFFVSVYNDNLFQTEYSAALQEAVFYVDEEGRTQRRSKEESDELIKQWIDANTTVSISDDFFEKKQILFARREQIIAPIKEKNKEIKDISQIQEQVFEIIRTTRDDIGQYDGNSLTPEQQEILRDLQQEIEDSKAKLYSVIGKGLTGEEAQELFELWNAKSEGFALEQSEEEMLEIYLETWNIGLGNFKISEEEIKELLDIEKQLSELSQIIYTTHYTNIFQQFYDSDETFKEIFNKFLIEVEENFDLEDSDNYVVQEKHIKALFTGKYSDNEYSKRNFLEELRNANSDFDQFIERNHIKIQRQEEINGKDQKVNILRNTAVWQFSQPLDENAYNTYVIKDQNGNAIELLRDRNNTLRVPNFNFQKREVKDEYLTEINTEDYIDESGNLVVRNYNLKDQWLPKETSKYRNDKYFDMFNSNRPKWDLLNYIKNWHLENQMYVNDANKKLDISYPKLRTTGLEKYSRKDVIRRQLYKFTDLWRVKGDDVEIAGFDTRAVRRGKKMLDSYTRPVSGVYDNIPHFDVSTDIIGTAQRYSYSLQEYATIQEFFPFANTVKNILENFNDDTSLLQTKNNLNEYAVLNPGKIDNRIKSINAIIDRHIKGQKIQDPTKNRIIANNIIQGVTRLTSRKYFMYNPTAGIRNWLSGQIQAAYLLADYKNYVTPVDLTVGFYKSKTLFAYQMRAYSLKTKTAQMQLMDILDASPDRYSQVVDEAGVRNPLKDLQQGKMGWYMRQTLTHQFGYQAMYAFMNNKKFKFELNGKMVSLDEVVELVDDRVQTKAGVPEEFSITYDENGKVIFGEKIKDLMNRHQDYLLKTVGMAGQNNEGDWVNRSLIGKILFSMMKFIVPMNAYRWGTRVMVDKNAPLSKKLKFRKRKNMLTGQLEQGYFVELIKAGRDIFEGGFTLYKKRNFTYNQYVALTQFVASILMTELIRHIIGSVISFTTRLYRDDDEIEYSEWTIDDLGGRRNPNAIQRLEKIALPRFSWVEDDIRDQFDMSNYMKLQAVNLLFQVERENETFFLPDMLATAKGYVVGDNPWFGGIPNEFGRWMDWMQSHQKITSEDMLEQMVRDNRLYLLPEDVDKTKVKRAVGPYFWQQEGYDKLYNNIGRFYGFNGTVMDPALGFKRGLSYYPQDWFSTRTDD